MSEQTRDRAALAAACAIALVSTIVSATSIHGLPWVTPDGANYALVARSLLQGDGYTEPLVPFHPAPYDAVRHLPELHGLLRPLLLVPLIGLLGEAPFVLRLPGLAFVLLTVVVVYLWGRSAFGRTGGLVACALTATSVGLPYFALLSTDDTGAALFCTASLALLATGLATGRDRAFLAAGVLGGVMLLEKPSGILLAGVFLAPLCRLPRAGVRRVARWLGLLFVPLLGVLALYLLRNQVAYGSPGFRFGVLGWILRSGGYEAMMQVFAEPPALGPTLAELGWARIARAIRADAWKLVAAIGPTWPWHPTNPFTVLMVPTELPMLGLAGMLALARRHTAHALVSALAVLGTGLLVCVVWRFELRFLSVLIPLCALWVGGLVAAMASAGATGPGGRALRLGGLGLGAWCLVASMHAFIGGQRTLGTFPDLNPCRAATEWIGTETEPSARVLSFDPWFTAWATNREAVMIPTGGPRVLGGVARRYDTHWLLAYRMFTRPRTSRTVMGLDEHPGGLRVVRRYDDGRCRVYRLDWEAARRPPPAG